MRIQFDEKNLRAEMVNSRRHGVLRSEVDRAAPNVLKALAAFRASKVGQEGFPTLAKQDGVGDIVEYAASVRGTYDTVCVVGIGGSALGAWALDCGLRGPHPVQGAFTPEHPRLVILDNVDPEFIELALASMDPAKTLVLVIGKSGDTAETVSTFLMVRAWLSAHAPGRIVAVTSVGTSELWKLADANGYRCFDIPQQVGGRFSVFSPVGLVPAALIGADIRKLLKGVAAMTELCWQADLETNVALRAALYHWLILTRKGKSIQVAFPYSNRLWGTAFWFRQLWAESLGKKKKVGRKTVNVGQTPVAALGPTDQHSQVQLYVEGPNDKVFTFWTIRSFRSKGNIPAEKTGQPSFDALRGKTLAKLIDAEQRGTAAALCKYKRPNCTYILDRLDEVHLGAFLQMLEFQTAFMGELLGINAFDQPGVQLGKKYTNARVGHKDYRQYLPELDKYESKRAALR